jgi:hypothetical protein
MGYSSRQSQDDWEEAYTAGYEAGYESAQRAYRNTVERVGRKGFFDETFEEGWVTKKPKRKQKPSAWNKFVKANSKKKKFIYQSGANKGKLNLKKMGVAWRKTPAGKKKR